MRRTLLALFVVPVVLVGPWAPAGAQPVITDELYDSHHPRLLFTNGEIPALQSKVADGGRDDTAYQFICTLVQYVYPPLPVNDLLGAWYGDGTIQNLGLVSRIESPPDGAALALGKTITLHVANNWEPNLDEAHSGMRLRSLALGYDMFFADASEAERGLVRDEIVRYIQKMIWFPAYEVFEQQPYLANHSAMFGAALGLAAIALQGETEAYLVTDAMAMADRIAQNLLLWQFDEGGAYGEGNLYALWTLRNLIPYFAARERFDGYSYADHPRLRAVEEWLAYELLPEGAARSHNLNDSVIQGVPYARSTTYFDWAIHEWGSGLAAWLWEHAAGTYGIDMASEADKASTVLWHRTVPQVAPGTVLPKHRIWLGRGLYTFRTGWQEGYSSDDVVFSFYSGKFQGGHAQEDQNQFALYGYGERFVIDHGAGAVGKQSEAHNMVLIDGQGQHNAGGSVGTDGRIAEYLLGGMADYVVGDAASAYATYSEYNAPDYPYQGADWSWGYNGSNPVEFAWRRVLTVHGDDAPPYFVVMDDIRKDDAVHDYEWRLHTLAWNDIDTAANPMTIAGDEGTLDVHLLSPVAGAVTIHTEPFNNQTTEADAQVLCVTRIAVEPSFSFLLIPRRSNTPGPAVSRSEQPWGHACTIDWGGGVVDQIVRNNSGAPVSYGDVETDGLVTVIRNKNGGLAGYLAAGVSSLSIGGTTHVTVGNGAMTCELSGPTLHIDRYDADFRVRNLGVTKVVYRDQELGFTVDGDDIVRGGVTAVGDTPPAPVRALALSAHPNPFNPLTTVRIDGDPAAPTRVAVYDVMGRRVRLLWDAPLRAESRAMVWDGRNDAGAPAASGVYIVKASTPSGSTSLKLTLLK